MGVSIIFKWNYTINTLYASFLLLLYTTFRLSKSRGFNVMPQSIYECTLNPGTQCNCQVVLCKPQL